MLKITQISEIVIFDKLKSHVTFILRASIRAVPEKIVVVKIIFLTHYGSYMNSA
jgi:hypothetical protein